MKTQSQTQSQTQAKHKQIINKAQLIKYIQNKLKENKSQNLTQSQIKAVIDELLIFIEKYILTGKAQLIIKPYLTLKAKKRIYIHRKANTKTLSIAVFLKPHKKLKIKQIEKIN